LRRHLDQKWPRIRSTPCIQCVRYGHRDRSTMETTPATACLSNAMCPTARFMASVPAGPASSCLLPRPPGATKADKVFSSTWTKTNANCQSSGYACSYALIPATLMDNLHSSLFTFSSSSPSSRIQAGSAGFAG
jgi:hypothetical protein